MRSRLQTTPRSSLCFLTPITQPSSPIDKGVSSERLGG